MALYAKKQNFNQGPPRKTQEIQPGRVPAHPRGAEKKTVETHKTQKQNNVGEAQHTNQRTATVRGEGDKTQQEPPPLPETYPSAGLVRFNPEQARKPTYPSLGGEGLRRGLGGRDRGRRVPLELLSPRLLVLRHLYQKYVMLVCRASMINHHRIQPGEGGGGQYLCLLPGGGQRKAE